MQRLLRTPFTSSPSPSPSSHFTSPLCISSFSSSFSLVFSSVQYSTLTSSPASSSTLFTSTRHFSCLQSRPQSTVCQNRNKRGDFNTLFEFIRGYSTQQHDNNNKNNLFLEKKEYNPSILEVKWQQLWLQQQQQEKENKAKEGKKEKGEEEEKMKKKKKWYQLAMFPYPSGKLHMGHVRVYTISDTLARVARMSGLEVLHPMGWDAFGLPAENAAIDRGIPPASWTFSNIEHMKLQLERLGMSFDWSREVTTCKPDYYKWTQWLFLQLHSKGLAYQKEALVNWDPVDQTVLANEQVDSEGRSWRSGAVVKQRMMKQWFFKITNYADSLLNAIGSLSSWPEQVKTMQRNWIGRSCGAELHFSLLSPASSAPSERLKVFTTRVDTVFGVTYIAIAPEHPLLPSLTTPEEKERVEEVLANISRLTPEERGARKDGAFLGSFASHPFTEENVPIYVASYVLPDYGTGAVMGVPAHDQRDWLFAKDHLITVKKVVVEKEEGKEKETEKGKEVMEADGILVDSDRFTGMTSKEARKAIGEEAKRKEVGGLTSQYRLRDWLISRQRYWGTPIPIIHCEGTCEEKVVPVPPHQLPVILPEHVHITGRSGNPLLRMKEWVNTTCPKCGGPGRRETDTMDTFVDSSWYFLRYPDPQNPKEICSQKEAKEWLPVDMYIGGVEHAILHLLYSRFITRFLHEEMDLVPSPEPFVQLFTQEMVYGRTFKTSAGKYLSPEDIKFLPSPSTSSSASTKSAEEQQTAVDATTGAPVAVTWEKMSKSKYNGVDPMDAVGIWGADVMRLFILFKAPPDKVLEWDDRAIQGPARWLSRLWSLVESFLELRSGSSSSTSPSVEEETKPKQKKQSLAEEEEELKLLLHQVITDVTNDIKVKRTFNTAISQLMKLSNTLGASSLELRLQSDLYYQALRSLVLMLAPMAPHICSEMWEALVTKGSHHSSLWAGTSDSKDVSSQQWPTPMPLSEQASVTGTVVIQVSGKRKGELQVELCAFEDDVELEKFVKSSPFFQRIAGTKTEKKLIIAKSTHQPGLKVINFIF
jgi:leucyl-tRNA synthetase